MFRQNLRYKVKTPDGYKNFNGVQKLIRPTHHHIIFEDGGELKVSERHTFGSERISPATLRPGSELNGRVICYNEVVEETIELYDLVGVKEGNIYTADDIV